MREVRDSGLLMAAVIRGSEGDDIHSKLSDLSPDGKASFGCSGYGGLSPDDGCACETRIRVC